MLSKNKTFFLVLFALVILTSNSVFSQNANKEKQTNAELVLQLIRTTSVTKVYIVATNYHRAYEKNWLEKASSKDSYMIFRNGSDIHFWNLENVVFIEKYGDIIKVRLPYMVGQ